MEETGGVSHCGFPLNPVIKLSEPMTHDAALNTGNRLIVVKAQELFAKGGRGFSKWFYRIKEAGGVHQYFNYGGKILLSHVMHNRVLRNCTTEMYAEAIDVLQPNLSTTIDGETYLDKQILAKKECARCLDETAKLMNLCPNHRFVGLVKGASVGQVELYLEGLLTLGMTDFALHAGDFLCRGNRLARESAIQYARVIRPKARTFTLYGASSPLYVWRFPPADAYITQTHFIMAFNGQKLINGHWQHVNYKADSALITHNFNEMRKAAENVANPKGGLMTWEAGIMEAAALLQEAATASVEAKKTATSL